MIGLAKMHFDAEVAKSGRVYLADDADPEDRALADDFDGTSDEAELRKLARELGDVTVR